MDSEFILSLILFFIESSMLALVLESAITSRLKVPFTRLPYMLTRIVAQLLRSRLMRAIPIVPSDLISMLINMAMDFLIVEMFFRGEHLRKIITIAVFYSVCFFSEYITIAAFTIAEVLRFEPVELVSGQIRFMALVSRSILPSLTIFYIKLRGKLYGRLRADSIKKAALIPPPLYLCVFFVLFHPLSDKAGLFYSNPKLVFTASFLTALISTIYMTMLVFYISKERRLSEKVEYQFLLYDSIESTIKQLSSDHRRLTAAYHDIGNILSAMELLSESGEISRLRKRLDVKLVSTGNIHIDSMIYAKRNALDFIGLELSGSLPESIDWLDPIDLFIIIGNALDNAIESLKKIPPEDRKAIQMELAYGEYLDSKHVLAIKVKNRSADLIAQGDTFVSTKKEPGHGNGLKNIRYAVDRANGTMSIMANGGFFELSIMLFE